MATDFDRHATALHDQLERREVRDGGEADAAELAALTGLSEREVRRVVLSTELARASGVPAAEVYGALPDTDSPLSLDPGPIRSALEQTIEAGVETPLTSESLDVLFAEAEKLRPKRSFAELTLDELLADTGREGARHASAVLRELGVETPAALAALDTEKARRSLGPDEAGWQALAELQSRARLGLLELSDAGRKALVRLGFTAPPDIAAKPLAEFKDTVGRILGVEEAERIHATARVQTAILENALIRQRTQAMYALTGTSALDADLGQSCECRDCEAATSPIAYLTDLLTYCGDKLSWRYDWALNPQPMDTLQLAALLQQPLQDLPSDCSSVFESVPQVRLCIESILGLIRSNLSGMPDAPALPIARRISFAIAADIDGDRHDELIVGFDQDNSALIGTMAPVGTGFWVLRYDTASKRWTHRAPGGDPAAAAFYLPPGLKVAFAAAGRFKADALNLKQDRRQVVLALEEQGATTHRFWALEFDPNTERWQHATPVFSGTSVSPGGVMPNSPDDFAISPTGISIEGGFVADVDGDGLDEFVAYGRTPSHVNPFWVLKLENQGWSILGPTGQPYDISFDCFPPATGMDFSIKFARAGDVNGDGRDEILVFSKAPLAAGKNPWIMLFDPASSSWRHLVTPGTNVFDADADLSAYPWPTAHAMVGDFTGVNSSNLIAAPERVLSPTPSDPERFTIYSYVAGDAFNPEPYFNPLEQVDCSPTTHNIRFALAADVDGDGRDELLAFVRVGNVGGVEAAYVMKRAAAGWVHLSPIAGHPFGADLEWTPGGTWGAARAFAADVDGDGSDEIVITGSRGTDIWVMKYLTSSNRWEHLRSADRIPTTRYESAAYQMLLEQIGTSYPEIRLAQSASPAERATLAERLSIRLGPRQGTTGDALDQLLADPATITQERLEELFGLTATTRDPFSNLLVSGDTAGQTRHWRIEGIDWSADPATATTDASGRLYASLDYDTNSAKTIVTLFRDAARQSPMALGEGPKQGVVRLAPLNGSGVSGRVTVDYTASNNGITLRGVPLVAAWQSAKLREQWDQEDAQVDPFTATSVSPTVPQLLPIIDPDLLGPDDFRWPLPSAAGSTAAFDLWLTRRAYVDGLRSSLMGLQPNLAAMLDLLRPPTGAATPTDYPWYGAPAVAEFAGIWSNLTTGDAKEVDAARKTVTDDLHLSVDGFIRLMELRERDQAGTAPLTSSEWNEISSILVQAFKASRYQNWRQEESAASVGLSGETFVTTPTSPVEGAWPAEIPAATPLVDPETIGLADMPRSVAGLQARGLWRKRRGELQASFDLVHAARPNGLEQVLVTGLGTPPAGATWSSWISARAQELDSSDPAVVDQAETDIRSSLPGVSFTLVRRLAGIANKPAGATISEPEWADVETAAAAVRKHRVLYPTWLTEEAGAHPVPYWKARRALLPRWTSSAALRAQWEQALRDRARPAVVDPDLLPPSRIRNTSSKAWELYFGRPIVGAPPGRLRQLTTLENAIRQLLASATTPLAGVDAAIVGAVASAQDRARLQGELAAWRTAAGFGTVLEAVLGEQSSGIDQLLLDLNSNDPDRQQAATRSTLTELGFTSVADFRSAMNARQNPTVVSPAQWTALQRALTATLLVRWAVLSDQRAAESGTKVSLILPQLGLTASAWRRVVAIRRLAAGSTTPLMGEELDDLVSILVRSQKVWWYARWRDEERVVADRGPVRLGPDTFRISPDSDATAPEWTPNLWRAAQSELRWWRNTLEARTAQHEQIFSSLRSSVARVEESTLPLLRDSLIARLPAPGGTMESARKWVADFLLVDPSVSGCQRTTRVGHAIDSLLALIWSVRTSQLTDTYPQLVFDGSEFEQEWPWIGSYGAWRSAMLVHLYPENLALPSLKRRKSPAFQSLLEVVRSGRRLTPLKARELAANYGEYFQEVCSLRAGACANASTRHYPTANDRSLPVRHQVSFLFGVSSSAKVYWSMLDRTLASPDFAQSWWAQLPGFSGPIVNLIGATTYETGVPGVPTQKRRYVFLFATVAGDDGLKLQFLRYDLETGNWDTEATPLELPENATAFDATLLQNSISTPPRLLLTVRTSAGPGASYTGDLNVTGTGWGRDEPTIRAQSESWLWKPLGPDIVVGGGPARGVRSVVTGDFDGDGLPELLVGDEDPQDRAAWENDFWLIRRSANGWSQVRNLNSSDLDVRGRAVGVGDFDRDGRDEVLIRPEGPNAADNRFWVMRYDGNAWQHVGRPSNFLYDLNCNWWEDSYRAFTAPASFAVVGDFDGDGQAEVAVAIAPGQHTVTTGTIQFLEKAYNAFWVFKLLNGQWKRLGSMSDLKAAFFCCTNPNQTAAPSFAVSGDFDGDGRDEIAIAASAMQGNLSLGNDFWVMDYFLDQWRPLGWTSSSGAQTVFDLGADDVVAAFAIAGRFDDSGRDKLVIGPYVNQQGQGTTLWLAGFTPGPDRFDPVFQGAWSTRSMSEVAVTYEVAQIVAADVDGDGLDEILLIPVSGNTVQFIDYDRNARVWRLTIQNSLGSGPNQGIGFAAAGNFDGSANGRDVVALFDGNQSRILPSVGSVSAYLRYRYQGSSAASTIRTRMIPDELAAAQCSHPNTKPDFEGPYVVRPGISLTRQRQVERATLLANASKPLSQRAYLEEAFFLVPLQLALALQRARNFETALDWFRLVYDYGQPAGSREIYPGLVESGSDQSSYVRDLETWLADPLDPHAIAATRPGTYRRGVLILIIRCLLEYADAEFTLDTSESIARARVLYGTALELLGLQELHQRLGACKDLVARISVNGGDPALRILASTLSPQVARLDTPATIRRTLVEVAASLEGPEPIEERAGRAERVVVRALSGAQPPQTISSVLAETARLRVKRYERVLGDENVLAALPVISFRSTAAMMMSPRLLTNQPNFCVGPNPILEALRIHAEVNLTKIRTCRNITGIRRSVDPYSGPTDQRTGLPTISADGQLVLPRTGLLQPTPYRYSVLLQRAKELLGHTQQLESLMLSALEKRDDQALTLLKARQDVQVARATVRVDRLRVNEAQDRVTLAELQQQRSEIEGDHYEQLLDAGDLELERQVIGWLEAAATYSYVSAGINFATAAAQAGIAVAALYTQRYGDAAQATASALTASASATSNLAQAASTWAQIQQTRASMERTRQEWRLRAQLAKQDQRISAQQVRIETDQVRIAEQELVVAELQTDNAEALMEFHRNKFTNLELYDWMSGILETAYGRLLQQATATAQLAARQLAFERQEGQPPAIQADYWDPPAESLGATEPNGAIDRRGLTGSARLLQDLTQLDQWAFETNRRKLQLTKTFSLAQLFPLDFEQLRLTGVISFATPPQLFDSEFPGHYLRLIKRVSVTVVALVPPIQGIRASLSNTGLSRAVVGPDVFQNITIRRPPESIGLSAPFSGTGMFTFEQQSELANPFESQGVDTIWEFRMPPAGNQFEFRSLADVLVTVDYTALDSHDHRQQVIRQLERRFTGDRAFSLRRDFPDAWWDLHNPDQIARPMVVSFETDPGDFPPNLREMEIEHLAVLLVTGSAIPPEAVPLTVRLVERGSSVPLGGSAMPVEHLVSTRRANGGPLRPLIGKTPYGRWELALTDSEETRDWLASDELADILVVVTYAAETPAWPA